MPECRLLSRSDVERLLGLGECIEALERAYLGLAEGRGRGPAMAGVEMPDGVVHVKAAGTAPDPPLVVVKANGNFPGNGARHGLPTIHGLILLFDGASGVPIAVLDSTEVTRLRTGAATALAARRLARPDASSAVVCGCGLQGRVQLEALARVLPLRRAFAWDLDAARARSFAAEISRALDLEVEPVQAPGPAVRASDVCVTCTPSRRPFLRREDVPPGAFVAAVGADNPHKQELDPAVLAAATLVVDDLEQCATSGELHHALEAGLLARADVHAELVDVVAGRRPGRTSEGEIVVFDSTGTAVQDLAAAALVHARAVAQGVGARFDFFSAGTSSRVAELELPAPTR